jgi:hypothetical protein
MNTVGVLISFWYYKQPAAVALVADAAKKCVADGNRPSIIIDSGAFSADTQGHNINVEEYADWLAGTAMPALKPYVTAVLNLDVLRNPTKSLRNWLQLAKHGHETIPVVHLGDNPATFTPYIDAGADYIALGAMVGRDATRKIRWAAHMFHYLKNHYPHVRLHGLGIGGQKLVESLPWYSVDSSGFASGYRFARVKLYDPKRNTFNDLNLRDNRTLHKNGRLLRDTYGVTPQAISLDGVTNKREHRDILIRLTRNSIIHWQTRLQKRHAVPAPKKLFANGAIVHNVIAGNLADRPPALHGPIIHYVDAAAANTASHLHGANT